MKKGAWIDFSLWLAATELVGILSGWLAGDIRAVYQNLHQPPFSPPGWVFPVMWGILYATMAISAYLIRNACTNIKIPFFCILYRRAYLRSIGIVFPSASRQ